MQRVTPDGDVGFSASFSRCLNGERPGKIGVALSGGGDSTALLVLMMNLAGNMGFAVEAVTVNHGLRAAAAAEASQAAALCADLGARHETVMWQDWDGTGNLQDAARKARKSLISDWAKRRKIRVVALGHTLDDQAETLLLRLARGSGVDGLSAMSWVRVEAGIRWIRPLLGVRRAALRDILRQAGVGWSEDPSNEDMRFDRVRIRKAMRGLADIGLTVEGLGKTAERLGHARRALELATQHALQDFAGVTKSGYVEIDRQKFCALNTELQRRVMAHSLMWVSGNPYRPRLASLEKVLQAVASTTGATLAGCLVLTGKGPGGDMIRIGREPASVAALRTSTDGLWDGKWQFQSALDKRGLHLAALGKEGLRQCPDWRDCGLMREFLPAIPAVWCADTLVSAPLAGLGAGWSCNRVPGADDFTNAVLSH